MTASDELRQSDLEAEFGARWKFKRSVSGLPCAQRPRTSPPVWLQGEDWTDLRDQVRAWLAARELLAGAVVAVAVGCAAGGRGPRRVRGGRVGGGPLRRRLTR